MKKIISNYIFDASAKTITLSDYDSISLERVLLIANVVDNIVIYDFSNPLKGGSVLNNVLTLEYDTTSMSDTDNLQIWYDDGVYEESGAVVTNARQKFRDGFALGGTQPDPTIWDTIDDNPSANIIETGGNSSSSSYLRISLSPFHDDNMVSITSKKLFAMPFRVGYGISLSQRIVGVECGMEMVGVDENGNVDNSTPIADKAITGATITIASNVGTVTCTGHGLVGGDRIAIYGCEDPRMNVSPVVVTVVDADNFTVPITASNGTYSSLNGYIRVIDPFLYAKNGASYLTENATATNATVYNRRNGSSFRALNSTIATTVASQANTSPFTDSFISAATQEIYSNLDEVSWRSVGFDGVATPSGLLKRTQGIPDNDVNYKMRVRIKNIKGLTKPIARITSISKGGTTTATVTTDVKHNLTTSDWIQIYGVRDIANFPNLTAQTQVSSVIDDYNFTVVMTGAVTANSAGGVVWKVQGSVLAPGVYAQNIQSISRTNNVLAVVGNTTWATPLPGETVHLYGLDGSGAAYEGAYKVLKVSTSTLYLESVGDDFVSLDCGGSVIKRTDLRIHFVRVLDYTRLVTEIVGGRGNTTDINNAVPVAITGSATLAATVSGGAAIDAAVAGTPVGAACRASLATPAAVSADGDVQLPWVDRVGRQMISQKCATATKTNVSGSASSTQLLAANTSRLGATIYNDSSAIMYLNLGSTATSTDFTVKLEQDDYYEVPFGYTGVINAIWASATGAARITELSS